MSYTRLGVHYHKVRSYPSRYSNGRVHVEFWDKLNKVWRMVCRPTVIAVAYTR